MNNEQAPSSSDTPADRVASGGAAAKLPTIIPDTPIVSIAAGTMSESTTTTTVTKTTPTPFPQEQLMTMMSDHVAKADAQLDEACRNQGAKDEDSQGASPVAANHVATSGSSSSGSDPKKSSSSSSSHSTGNHDATADAAKGSAAEAAAGDTSFSQVFAMLKDSPSAELSRPNRRVLQYGATAKGKTQDDQNVGKRQKKKKTKYDTWEDSDFNDLDDASLKKLLEEAYWYRNPGDRKNKSERFLQMLKKAEYDEEISYRAIKSCLTINPSALTSSATGSSGGSSSSAGHNSSYNSTNHRSTDPGQRHKQGGSLQDLVEAAHRSELATTSAAAAAAATAAATQRFNCDYQLSGRSNRRQQQQQQQHNQNATSSASASKKIKNLNVSGRQREGGSLPSSVNFEPASSAMEAKQNKQQAQPSTEAAGGSFSGSVGNKHHHRSSTGSCSSLLTQSCDAEASNQFDLDVDMDDATGVGARAAVGASDVQDDNILGQLDPQNPSMKFLIDALNDKPLEARYTGAGKKFLIDDRLHFSVLELSARRKLQQQAQYLAALTGQFGLGLEEEKRKVEAGYVSLNDNYTACSSVYGGGAGSPAAVEGSKPSTSSSAVSGGGNCAASSDSLSTDLRPAKIGRMVPAAAAVAAAPMGGKTTTRQLDENGNALGDGFGGSAASGASGASGSSGASAVASSSNGNGNGNQFTALITTTVGSSVPTSTVAHRQNSVSTLLSTGTNTTTTAMAAAAVAASYSQLQQAPVGGAAGAVSGIGIGMQQPTKQKAKKKSQQERNTTTVDVESVAGYRGNDPVEQLLLLYALKTMYADIARNKQEALNNATASDTEFELGDKMQSKSGGKSKSRPDFPELPGAVTTGAACGGAANQATVVSNQNTPPSSSSSISYSQSLNATPPSSSSDAESTNSPELLAQVQIPAYSMVTPTLTASMISSVSSSAASTSSTSCSPPALQKSKSVEHDTSYSCNSSNLDQQYPALEKTVKRHSTNNVSVAVAASTSASVSSSLYNFAAAAKQADNAHSVVSPSAVTTTSTVVAASAPATAPATASAPALASATATVTAPAVVTVPCYSSSSTHGSTQTSSSTASSSIAALPSSKAKTKPKELSPSRSCSKKPTKPSQDVPSISLSISTTPKATTSTSTTTTQKTTAATQTEGAKKLISGIHKLPSSSCIAKGAGAVLEATAARRAVIILNDDREAGRSNNEFIFGDFNEDELKLFDDNLDDEEDGQHKQSSNKKQQTEAESDVTQDDTEDVDQDLDKELECLGRRPEKKQERQQDVSASSDQHLNDSGAASDAVNSSASIDMLSISAEAAQSSPNAGATATSSSVASPINSSTPSGASSASASTSTSSSSVSISSSSGGNGAACLASVSGMLGGVANQSGDSGIYAAANTSIKEHVNNFLSKASSSEETLPSPNSISMQQLETCNDIEAAIIAAARAAAAARSTSCSRSNSQEQDALQPQVKTKATPNPNPEAKMVLPVFVTYNNNDDAEDEEEDDESLQELSFMADLKADAATEDISMQPPPPPPSCPAMMTNTELIVDYIAKTWNAISNSKYVTYYNEQEREQET
ncbi:GD16672 [Drosophila simulans]|uniref:GD16672 n=1 Tax=Drosophila simulans TaxID=7240 RepID=B4R4F2_DROSI|nr:GD16672 [Drosophila simulans]